MLYCNITKMISAHDIIGRSRKLLRIDLISAEENLNWVTQGVM